MRLPETLSPGDVALALLPAAEFNGHVISDLYGGIAWKCVA